MQAWTYLNSATNIPGFVDSMHLQQPRGYSYDCDGTLIHIYGTASDLWVVSTGLAVWQSPVAADHPAWLSQNFGATEKQLMTHKPSEVVHGVWRPGLVDFQQTQQALSISPDVQNRAEQGLRVLLDKLDEILTFIEPSRTGLAAYGHKSRELLILACTEVENGLTQYLRLAGLAPKGQGFTTNDYVRLLEPLYLAEFEIEFKPLALLMRPFASWSASQSTQSLAWYHAYNKTKHDRENHFEQATLENCLLAIAAAITLFCVRYGPFALAHGQGTLSGLYRQHFALQLKNPDPATFYIPQIFVPSELRRPTLSWGGMSQYVRSWTSKPLVV